MSEFLSKRQSHLTKNNRIFRKNIFPTEDFSFQKKITLITTAVIGFLFIGFFIFLISGLPDLIELENVNPAQATRVFSSDGKVIHELFTFSRIWISYDQIPETVIQSVLATEDRVFYEHWGIDLKRVIKPVIVNLISLSYKEGFSTITMQVARNLFEKIGFERSILRKLREILTAFRIERTYSKKEILEMYLNVSYFGRGAYGIQSAAKKYFNKDARELTTTEGAFLIGLLKGPAYYSPVRHPEQALLRRSVVLHNMFLCNYINRTKYDSLKQLPLLTAKWSHSADKGYVAPYFTEYVRQQLNKLQKTLGINVYEDGLNVYTTLNTVYQAAIDSAIQRQLPAIQKRVTNNLLAWKKENEIPDSVFTEKSQIQIAFVALDHRTGKILAMVGGRDFDKSKFNLATQARRQPGSTFKPFLYAAAIDNGYTAVDKFPNQPVVLTNPDGTRWTPENFSRKFGGATTLRDGIKKSLNLVSARLILEIGPQIVVDYAKQMGLTTPLKPYPSLSMGSSEVIPLEMVSAFGVFANQGIRVEPISITRIEDRHGNIIYEHKPHHTEVLNRSTAYIMTDLLQNAINHGTGGSARWKYHFYAPAAGKTGTTNEYTDAWFIGFTPELTAGLWVGLDDQALKLGKGGTGSATALPFWADFMKTIYDSLDLPKEPFQQPPEIISLSICEDSGEIATNFCPNVIENQPFKLNNHPTETCHIHSGAGKPKDKFRSIF